MLKFYIAIQSQTTEDSNNKNMITILIIISILVLSFLFQKWLKRSNYDKSTSSIKGLKEGLTV